MSGKQAKTVQVERKFAGELLDEFTAEFHAGVPGAGLDRVRGATHLAHRLNLIDRDEYQGRLDALYAEEKRRRAT